MNKYIFQNIPIIHTKASVDTDPYGHPAMVYIHEGGLPGIISQLRSLLRNDFYRRLNVPFYQQFLPLQEQQQKAQVQHTQPTQLSEASEQTQTAKPEHITEAEQAPESAPAESKTVSPDPEPTAAKPADISETAAPIVSEPESMLFYSGTSLSEREVPISITPAVRNEKKEEK